MPSTAPAAGREPGGSAGAALLTILGEYVVPHATGVWQETLVRAMGVLGFPAPTVRQAISRAVRDGALTTTRHGNRAYVELRDDARDTLVHGASYLHASIDNATPEEETCEWDVFVVRFRDKGANERYHLRTSLLLKGLGYLGNGVWISPPTRMRDDIIKALTTEPGASVVAMRSRIEHPAILDVVRRAWNLDAAADRYRDLLDRFGSSTVTDIEDRFAAWTRLCQVWRQCNQADPGLPATALPPDWPRSNAAEVFASRRRDWQADARAYFDEIATTYAPKRS
jgi:phenylacetic acid degradation operon negative regulatory protein